MREIKRREASAEIDVLHFYPVNNGERFPAKLTWKKKKKDNAGENSE